MENQNEIKIENADVNKKRKKLCELENENFELKCFIDKEVLRNEQFKNALLEVFKELDTVGFIHGAGSKARAKEKLIAAMKKRYGDEFWNKVIIEEEPEPANSPARPEDKPATEE